MTQKQSVLDKAITKVKSKPYTLPVIVLSEADKLLQQQKQSARRERRAVQRVKKQVKEHAANKAHHVMVERRPI